VIHSVCGYKSVESSLLHGPGEGRGQYIHSDVPRAAILCMVATSSSTATCTACSGSVWAWWWLAARAAFSSLGSTAAQREDKRGGDAKHSLDPSGLHHSMVYIVSGPSWPGQRTRGP
jgi:hypothetical protein